MRLLKEFTWYTQNQKELEMIYPNDVLVVFNREIVGVFFDELKALRWIQDEGLLGRVLIQRVGQEDVVINTPGICC